MSLPTEIWILIASDNNQAWRILTLAIPEVGRYSLQRRTQKAMMEKLMIAK
jgi:hypothetical protein